MLHEAAFKVSGLIRVPGIFLGEFVYHTDDLGEELLCFGLVRDLAQFCNGSPRRFLIIAVGSPSLGDLADALLC